MSINQPPIAEAYLPSWLGERVRAQGSVMAAQVLRGLATAATGRGDTNSATAFTNYLNAIMATAAYQDYGSFKARINVPIAVTVRLNNNVAVRSRLYAMAAAVVMGP